MHDVITLGSATLDVFVETEKNSSTTETIGGKQVPFMTFQSGAKVLIEHLQFEVGGGGTNTAVCFARLGLQTAYLGNVGNDNNGTQVLNLLKEEKVDFIGTRTDDLTNYSLVLQSSLLHDRTILVYKGASERLLFSAAPKVMCKVLYVSSLAGESFRTALRIMQYARSEGTYIAFNPSNYQIEHNRDDVLSMLQLSQLVVLNREEAALLVGEGSDNELLTRIRSLGPHIAVITLGSKGVVVMDHEQSLRALPAQVPVRETTGAGDCFASTFVAALMYGKALPDALRWALCNVENHIQHIGAKAGLLTHSELEYVVSNDTRSIERL